MEIVSRYLLKLPQTTRRIVRTCIYGLGAGLAAVIFHYAIEFLFDSTFVRLAHESTTAFLAGSFLVIVGTSLLVGFLLHRLCPEASGSGIPQLKAAYWKDFGYVSWRVVWVKFLAGTLSVGGGQSLGREGPSVQLAGGTASNIAGLLGESKQRRREAAAAGAAAGLAAAFNTPIAAVTFVLEEILGDLNSRALGSVLLASILGAFTAYAFVGKHPAFLMPELESPSWIAYLLTPGVAIISALLGVGFQRATLRLRLTRKRLAGIPAWTRPALGAGATWILGGALFLATGHLGVFGLGYDDMGEALNGRIVWQVAGCLMAAKLLSSIFCYGFGGCGGIFAPTLFFGAMCGLFLAGLVAWTMPHLGLEIDSGEHVVLAVVGMSACLGAVVRAPITSILIVFEMTHQFSIVPALMLGTLVSQAIAKVFCRHNFYDEILIQDGHLLDHVIPPRDLKSWQRMPVSAIANFQPVTTDSLNPDVLKELIRRHPYRCFPILRDGKVAGILLRDEIEDARLAGREPRLDPPIYCRPDTTIRELQAMLIDSASGVVLLQNKAGGSLIGIVTLHDLLRAQVSLAESDENNP